MEVATAFRLGFIINNQDTGKVVLPGSLTMFSESDILSIQVEATSGESYILIEEASVYSSLLRLQDLYYIPLTTPCDVNSIVEFEEILEVKYREDLSGEQISSPLNRSR